MKKLSFFAVLLFLLISTSLFAEMEIEGGIGASLGKTNLKTDTISIDTASFDIDVLGQFRYYFSEESKFGLGFSLNIVKPESTTEINYKGSDSYHVIDDKAYWIKENYTPTKYIYEEDHFMFSFSPEVLFRFPISENSKILFSLGPNYSIDSKKYMYANTSDAVTHNTGSQIYSGYSSINAENVMRQFFGIEGQIAFSNNNNFIKTFGINAYYNFFENSSFTNSQFKPITNISVGLFFKIGKSLNTEKETKNTTESNSHSRTTENTEQKQYPSYESSKTVNNSTVTNTQNKRTSFSNLLDYILLGEESQTYIPIQVFDIIELPANTFIVEDFGKVGTTDYQYLIKFADGPDYSKRIYLITPRQLVLKDIYNRTYIGETLNIRLTFIEGSYLYNYREISTLVFDIVETDNLSVKSEDKSLNDDNSDLAKTENSNGNNDKKPLKEDNVNNGGLHLDTVLNDDGNIVGYEIRVWKGMFKGLLGGEIDVLYLQDKEEAFKVYDSFIQDAIKVYGSLERASPSLLLLSLEQYGNFVEKTDINGTIVQVYRSKNWK